MLLELKGVTTYRGFIPAIQNISINVAENESGFSCWEPTAPAKQRCIDRFGVLRPRQVVKSFFRCGNDSGAGAAPDR